MIILFLYRRLRAWRERREGATGTSASEPRPSRSWVPASAGSAPSAAARGGLALIAHQVRYDVLANLRNPRARFFTFLFPVLLLVVFASVFGTNHSTVVAGVHVPLSHYFVGSILALAIITASYGNLVVTITTARETGVLKHRRATPVPPGVLIGGQALATLVTALGMSAVLLVIARFAYGVAMSPAALLAALCAVVVGTLAFACIGYAVAGLIDSADSAMPVVQASLLPLYFISGVWIPLDSLGHGLRSVASVFPVEHLAAALHQATVHGSLGSALAPRDLLVLAAWGVGAARLATRRFSWLPKLATA
jgi:ABC-2 type transport system permease protein